MGIENAEEWVVGVGRVSGTWDRALLKVQSFSENPDRFAVGVQLRAGSGKKLLEILSSRKSGHSYILDVGLQTTAEAQPFIGNELYVHPSMRPPLPEGEFYVDAVIGLRIVTESGEDLGVIEEVLETPVHDIYATPLAMVPSVPDFVVSRDFENKIIVVRDIPGLRIVE